MQTEVISSIQAMREAHAPQQVPPLESVTCPTVDTAAAETTHASVKALRQARAPQHLFIPLDQETRPTVTTAAAAFYLHYAEQSMRIFSSKGNGPIRPIRIGNRLHWSTEEIRRLLAEGAK